MKRLDDYWNSVNIVSVLLLPVSGLFCLISSLRKFFYHIGFFKSYKSPIPVIIVGNISVGGTGKTPLIIALVKQLQLRGKKPAVISRGYGGDAKIWPQLVNTQTHAKTVGDEPQLIFNQTQCPVAVGPNRKHDIELIMDKFDCDVVLSDDGLQHYALKRDVEIVVVDKVKQFGNGFCLPSGPLRESAERLLQVDMVLLNGGTSEELGFKMEPTLCVSVGKKISATNNLDYFSGKTVHVVAGIGNPERFFTLLRGYNIQVIPHIFKDHYTYRQSDINFNDDLCVLMTEKDAVKCTHFECSNHWSVPIEISLTESAQTKLNRIFDSLN